MASCNNKKCSFTESYDTARDGVTATPAVGLVRRRCNYSARSPWTEEDNEICKQKAAAILAAAASLTLLGGLIWQAPPLLLKKNGPGGRWYVTSQEEVAIWSSLPTIFLSDAVTPFSEGLVFIRRAGVGVRRATGVV